MEPKEIIKFLEPKEIIKFLIELLKNNYLPKTEEQEIKNLNKKFKKNSLKTLVTGGKVLINIKESTKITKTGNKITIETIKKLIQIEKNDILIVGIESGKQYCIIKKDKQGIKKIEGKPIPEKNKFQVYIKCITEDGGIEIANIGQKPLIIKTENFPQEELN